MNCRYCQVDLGTTGGSRDLLSERCLCRLPVETLRGLLLGEEEAIGEYRRFLREWFSARLSSVDASHFADRMLRRLFTLDEGRRRIEAALRWQEQEARRSLEKALEKLPESEWMRSLARMRLEREGLAKALSMVQDWTPEEQAA